MNEQQKIVIDKSIRPQMPKDKSLIQTIQESIQVFKAQIKYLEKKIVEAENVLAAVNAVNKEVKKNG